MRTRVVLTVDVEPSVAGAYEDPERFAPLIHEPVWGEVGGKSEALGFLIQTLTRFGLKATFFVETVHTGHFGPEAMGRYVDAIAEAGQDVQLHLHPTWLNLRKNGPKNDVGAVSDHCDRLDSELLVRIIEEGADQIRRWTGQRPAAMRTGNFSTDRNIYASIRGGRLRSSSSLCAAVHPPSDPNLRVTGGVHEIDGVLELPVTCFADRGPVGRGRLRPLQVTACSFTEVAAILSQLHAGGDPAAVIVTHPFEFIKRQDFRFSRMRPNRLVQQRFLHLCSFLAVNEDRFEVVTMTEAAALLTPPVPSPVLTGNPLFSTVRAAQNLVNDRIL